LTDNQLRALPLGDSAVSIVFGSERSEELLRRIQTVAKAIMSAGMPHVEDVVPAYLTLVAFYNSLEASYAEVSAQLLDLCEHAAKSAPNVMRREHRIVVTYDGPDLEAVAAATGLSTEDVVARHENRSYTVDLLGFVPGWAYLSTLDPAIQLPRRPQPRPRVPAGSVAIAGAQTGIYPLDTPGGWHIIGHTDAVMFDASREPPALLSPGDTVRFARAT
jgi:KipI family sensor histidine kinase inhibitor